MIYSSSSTVVEGCRIAMHSHQITGVRRDKTPSGTYRSAQSTKQECSHQQEYRGTQPGPIQKQESPQDNPSPAN
ncbi:unnamed protein product [Linum tenue]|uniref:Uncharacterized protein n=1 Tax=Linum tenue TaxID=586396 RepID=A0AAV0IS66_9ROSI|nr:unnamed protein product [Linum tenue]